MSSIGSGCIAGSSASGSSRGVLLERIDLTTKSSGGSVVFVVVDVAVADEGGKPLSLTTGISLKSQSFVLKLSLDICGRSLLCFCFMKSDVTTGRLSSFLSRSKRDW